MFSRATQSLLIALAAWGVAELASAEDPKITGTTTYIENGEYHPLDGVEVIVMRKSPLRSVVSKNGGSFGVEYPEGPPVYVLFQGAEKYVPQLQCLGAAPGMTQDVHVTVYTIQEAQRQGINVYAHVQAIVKQLEAAGVDDKSPVMLRLLRLMNRFG